MKKWFSLFCVFLLAISLTSCKDAPQTVTSAGSSQSLEESSSAIEFSSSVSGNRRAPEENPESTQRRIRIQSGESVICYELNDSRAAAGLYDQLPLTLPVEDFSTNEKIFYPAAKLDTTNAPLAEGGAGILAYYAPWGDVVLFYGDFNSNDSLYELGRILSGGEWIREISGTITIDKMEEPETESESDAPTA